MESLSPILFLVPGIALTLAVVAYRYFSKRVSNRRAYRRYVAAVAGMAYLLNFAWEVSQGFLYQGYEYDFQHISFCALASVADVFMVFLLLFGFGLIYGDVYWTCHLSPYRIAALMAAGGVGAIVAETLHTGRGSWSYAEAMPLLPWVNVGLTPVLQFTILPLVIFWACRKFING
ncbi:hypothetical protein [Persicitalea jodogahamensis]|uniref:Uncharacterized protein n=1 Tax=Persicitalea jodogahamensis TaxID=402147 RepID=A0A8J3GCD6_9BACT|nr:hypothetical protein [Persicitalea jodogahamensis]GHB87569.1 hypothetical protein GCM10007390_49370 [Persicitalea jodogahamensis]